MKKKRSKKLMARFDLRERGKRKGVAVPPQIGWGIASRPLGLEIGTIVGKGFMEQ